MKSRVFTSLIVYIAVMLIIWVIGYGHVHSCGYAVYEHCGLDVVKLVNWIMAVGFAHVVLLGYGIYKLITKRDFNL